MTEKNPATRQPKGIPVGGQFAASTRGEADLHLDGEFEPDYPVFTRTVHATYVREEVPKGCRVPRPVQHEVDLVATVPGLSADDAPVGIEIQDSVSRSHFRVYSGDLFEPLLPHSGQSEPTFAGDSRFPSETSTNLFRSVSSDSEAAIAVQAEMNEFIVVDGQVYRRCDEPRYVVQTFGFGGNHGGTGLGVTTNDNPNIAAQCYFRADDFEGARAFAIEVAEERGDTESASAFKTMKAPITVHDPHAIRLVTPERESAEVKERRATFREATRTYSRLLHEPEMVTVAEEMEAWERLKAARENLNYYTADVNGHLAEQRPYEEGRKPW